MKHTLVIDDRTAIGKHLLGIIKTIEANSKGIGFITETDEAKEDAAIARMIKKGLQSGLANKDTVLKKLSLK